MKDLFNKLSDILEDANKVVFMGIVDEKITDDAEGPYIKS